jgi:hypothetical protein
MKKKISKADVPAFFRAEAGDILFHDKFIEMNRYVQHAEKS